METILLNKKKLGYKIEDILVNLHNNSYAKIYEYDSWIDEELYKYIKISKYKICDADDTSRKYSDIEIDEIMTFDEIMKLNHRDRNTYGIQEFKYLYDYFKPSYNIETFKQLKGLEGNTTVYLYIDELKTAIVSSNINKDELLNLLTIKNLNLYVYKMAYDELGNGPHFLLFGIKPISTFSAAFSIKLEQIKIIKDRAKEKANMVEPSFELKGYLNLKNEENIIIFYNSLSIEQKRCMKAMLINIRGDGALRLIYSYFNELATFIKLILPIDLILQSVINIENYKEINKVQIDKDMSTYRNQDYIMKNYQYKIKFTEYKLLCKDVDIKFKELYKWLDEFFKIVEKKLTNDYSDNGINEDTIYYKIVQEINVALSKLWFVSEVILFGSVARGKEKYGSDIDIAYKIGIPTKYITNSKRVRLNNLVESQLKRIEQKYEKQVPGYPKYNLHGTGDFKIPIKKELINVLALSFHTKKQLDNYAKTGFFNDSKVLFKRDSFDFKIGDYNANINYVDINYAIIPTQTDGFSSTCLIKKIGNTPIYQFVYFDYIEEYDYRKDDKNKEYNYIAQELIYGFGDIEDFKIGRVNKTAYKDFKLYELSNVEELIYDENQFDLYTEDISRRRNEHNKKYNFLVNTRPTIIKHLEDSSSATTPLDLYSRY